jgi:transcriptional regulator with XRE-family HTH domain
MSELVTLRTSRGLSQRELAERASVSPATVFELEAGRRPQPRGSTLRKLAGALEVDVSELVEAFYYPKDSSLLTPERALKMPRERLAREIKDSTTDQLHKLLGALVGDDLTRSRADFKAGVEGISPDAFSVAIEVRAELIERGEKPPENRLPAFKRRLKALHLA